MKTASKQQLAKIHVLLHNLGLSDHDKYNMIFTLTNERTISSKQLTMEEAKRLIQHLCQADPKERLKSPVISLAYKCNILYGDTPEDKKINMAKLNQFLMTRGAVKKNLNYLTYAELMQVKRQFEAMNKNMSIAKDKKAADKAVSDLLKELQLVTI
jgi:hypothetical protein